MPSRYNSRPPYYLIGGGVRNIPRPFGKPERRQPACHPRRRAASAPASCPTARAAPSQRHRRRRQPQPRARRAPSPLWRAPPSRSTTPPPPHHACQLGFTSVSSHIYAPRAQASLQARRSTKERTPRSRSKDQVSTSLAAWLILQGITPLCGTRVDVHFRGRQSVLLVPKDRCCCVSGKTKTQTFCCMLKTPHVIGSSSRTSPRCAPSGAARTPLTRLVTQRRAISSAWPSLRAARAAARAQRNIPHCGRHLLTRRPHAPSSMECARRGVGRALAGLLRAARGAGTALSREAVCGARSIIIIMAWSVMAFLLVFVVSS